MEDQVLIEEWPKTLSDEMISNMKTWIDVYPCPVEVKGGRIGSIRPKRIIVTSNLSLTELFGDCLSSEGEAAPFIRRFKVRAFTEVYNAHGYSASSRGRF